MTTTPPATLEVTAMTRAQRAALPLTANVAQDQCRPCADKARQLRMVQCREGWHLDHEPLTDRTQPTEEHKELLAARADLVTAHAA